jgi:periplasmic protein TonB
MKTTTNIAPYFLLIGGLLFSVFGYSQSIQINKKESLQTPNSIFVRVDKSPEFPGGNEQLVHFILEHANLPADSAETPIVGKVLVQFVVETDGSLSDIKIIKGIGSEYDQECCRVFANMPKWAPGKIGKHNVRTLMLVPITIS